VAVAWLNLGREEAHAWAGSATGSEQTDEMHRVRLADKIQWPRIANLCEAPMGGQLLYLQMPNVWPALLLEIAAGTIFMIATPITSSVTENEEASVVG
jgi:hypothetical protein